MSALQTNRARARHDFLDGIPPPATLLCYSLSSALARRREGSDALQGVPYMNSPLRMQGDNKRPQKTDQVSADGWYRSGTVAQRDAHGFFNFPGRSEDMFVEGTEFVVGSENDWSDEVKRLVESGLGVHQATVVPAPEKITVKSPYGRAVRQADQRQVARRHRGLARSRLGWQLASGAAPYALCTHQLYRHALRTGTACDAAAPRCARFQTARRSAKAS